MEHQYPVHVITANLRIEFKSVAYNVVLDTVSGDYVGVSVRDLYGVEIENEQVEEAVTRLLGRLRKLNADEETMYQRSVRTRNPAVVSKPKKRSAR